MPAPTVASAENRLLVRCRAWMVLANLPVAPSYPSPPAEPNPYTLTAISDAAGQMGVADVVDGAPTDADLAAFTDPRSQVRFRELAELALLETILVNQPSLASSFSRSESFESHSITESGSNSSGNSVTSLGGRIDYLRRKYAADITPDSRAGVRVGRVCYPFPTPRNPSWGIGNGRIDH